MGNKWPEVTLTDIYDISSGLSKPAKDFGSGYPFLAFKDVFYNTFVPSELTQLVQSNEKEQAACSIRRGDVFLTRTSETMNELGMSAVALKDYDQATFNGFSKRLRPKPNNNLHPEYVAYYLRSPKFRTEMMAFSTMSTRASLNNEMISRLKISVPPIAVQKSISWILKTLDDKIELNRQINTTLETMAQALFKSWFVDFDPVIDNALAAGHPIPDELADRAERRQQLHASRSAEAQPLPAAIQQPFPDRFVFTEELGWLPEGWEAKDIGSILRRLKVKKRYKKKDVTSFGKIPVFEQGTAILLGYHDGDPDILASEVEPAFIFGDHTCVTKLSIEPFSISENIIALQGEKIDTFWAYYAVMGKQSFEEYRRHWMELAVKTVVVPSIPLTQAFAHFVMGMEVKKSSLSRQSSGLARMRDTLLPKLLSGQLRIPEAEQLIAEVL